MTKKERETLEYRSLFSDERYAKQAWKNVIGASLQSPGKMLPQSFDKDGTPTFQSQLDQMAYLNVKDRLKSMGIDREPMQAELIVECNILRARFSDTTLSTILERTAGKVKEELTVNKSAFEELTDEELEILQKHRDNSNKK